MPMLKCNRSNDDTYAAAVATAVLLQFLASTFNNNLLL